MRVKNAGGITSSSAAINVASSTCGTRGRTHAAMNASGAPEKGGCPPQNRNSKCLVNVGIMGVSTGTGSVSSNGLTAGITSSWYAGPTSRPTANTAEARHAGFPSCSTRALRWATRMPVRSTVALSCVGMARAGAQ